MGGHAALNADADTFVPHGQGEYENPATAKSVPEFHLTGTKPKEREYTENVETQILQQRLIKLEMAHHKKPDVSTTS